MADINIFALGGQDENGKDLFVIEVNRDIYVVNAGIKFPINDIWGIDGIVADASYLKENKKRIKGVFITHAHDDAFAAIPWLLMDIEGLSIYGSGFTMDVLANRISKYNIGHSNYNLNGFDGPITVGNIVVKPIVVANSIPGSFAYSFETKDGSIVVMSNTTIGDLGVYGNTDLDRIKKQVGNNVLALITDSREANIKESSFPNVSVTPSIEEKFNTASDNERIIVGAYDEEMYSIQETIDLANKHNRPVAFYGSAFNNLYNILLKYFPGQVNQPKKIINYKEVGKHSNAVILVTGTWSRIYQRFVRIAHNKDVLLKFRENDHLIFITPPINGMEVVYSQMLDEVAKISPDITSVTASDFDRMRVTKVDIKEIVQAIQPKLFIPTSALYRYQVIANTAAVEGGVKKQNALLMPNGKVIYIKDGEIASQKGKIRNVGDVIIQGFGVGDISYEVIKERQMLSAGGVVSIAVQFNKRSRQLVGEINTQVVGVVVKSELKELTEAINAAVIEKFEQADEFNYREIQNSIRKRVQKVVTKKVNKKPLVVITFYEV